MQYFINEAGERMAYVTSGDPANPPIIFVHGWMSYHRVWESTLPLFEQTHYCVAVHLLGHGRSAKPNRADYSIPAQGRRVLALADMLGLHRFALVGHSMGGQIAAYIAACLAPGRVTRLVGISPVITGVLSDQARFRHWLFNVGRFMPFLFPVADQLRRVPWMAHLLYGHPWFYDMYSLPREVWFHQADWVFDPKGVVPIYKAGHGIHAADLSHDLHKIHAPTLIFYGKQDRTLGYSQGELAAERIPDAELVLYDPCGHFPMFERVDDYQPRIRAFLNIQQ